jgi:hypothetical protein
VGFVDDVSPELMDFATLALNHAAESVVASGGPLTPFSMVRGPDTGPGQLTRFVCETLEEGLERARAKVSDGVGTALAAVAWDGYLTMDGTRTDAVFVEASEVGCSQSIILAQRYVAGETVHRIGEFVLAGRGKALF